MMIYDLPEDLVREILSRVPATSLIRLRSTCKQWNDLFKDTEFIKKQFSKSVAAEQSMIVMLKEARVYSMNITNVTSELITLKDSHYNSDLFVIDDIFYCDGLLLCIIFDKEDNEYKFVIWNPCLGQTRWIEGTPSEDVCDNFALGYDNNHKYKILGFFYDTNRQSNLKIYDYSLNSWKFLDEDVISDDWFMDERGVSLYGNTYWLGCDNSKKDEDHHLLTSFDFSTEKFQRHSLPPFLLYTDMIYMALSVVREEELLLLHWNFITRKMEICVTANNKTDQTKALSWIKFLTFDLYTPYIHFTEETNFFIKDVEKKIVVFYNKQLYSRSYAVHIIGEDRDIYNGALKFILSGPFVLNYVPSLVQIQQE